MSGRLLLTVPLKAGYALLVLGIGPGHKSPNRPDTWPLRVSGFLRSTSGHSAIEVEDIAFAQALLSVIKSFRLGNVACVPRLLFQNLLNRLFVS